MKTKLSRRSALRQIPGSAPAIAVASNPSQRLAAAESAVGPKMKGRVNHSVCKWCYAKVPLEEFCQSGKEIGLQSVELLEVKDFDTLKKYGLTCAMVTGVPGGIGSGLNRLENHDKIVEFMEATIPRLGEVRRAERDLFLGQSQRTGRRKR